MRASTFSLQAILLVLLRSTLPVHSSIILEAQGEHSSNHKSARRWATNVEALREFQRREGHVNLPLDYSAAAAPHLGSWLFRMRRQMGSTTTTTTTTTDPQATLTPEGKSLLVGLGVKPLTPAEAATADATRTFARRQAKLDSLGGTAATAATNVTTAAQQQALLDEVFKRGVTALFQYKLKHGTAEAPRSFVDEGGLKVGVWLAKLHRAAKRGALATKLSPEQITSMEALLGKPLGDDGHAHGSNEESGADGGSSLRYHLRPREYLSALRRFKAREGHADVPKKHKEPAVPTTTTTTTTTTGEGGGGGGVNVESLHLGGWLRNAIARAQRGELPEALRKQLEDLGVEEVAGLVMQPGKGGRHKSRQGGAANAASGGAMLPTGGRAGRRKRPSGPGIAR
jgi:hypothetical protein